MAKFFTPSKLSENIKETPEGFLLCLNVPVARTGWQDYGPGETPLEVGEDGKVWIHRESEEVFRPQTIASFNAKSITVKHPEDFVVPENWKELTVGIAQNIRKGTEVDEDGEEMLLADLLITDELAIGLVNNGLREVSCGYDAEYEETAEGEGRQFNIVGNHIALVEQGRAGSTYAIKDHKTKGEEEMGALKELAEKIKNLGKTVDEAVAAKDKKAKDLAAEKKKTGDEGTPEQVTYDDLMKKMADMNGKLDGLMGSKKSDDDGEEEEMAGDEGEESDEDKEVGQNGRLEKCEAAIAKILKLLGNKKADDEDKEESDEDMSGDEDMEESEDADEESESEDADESEEAEDEEAKEGEESQKKSKKTGDEAKFEILTPGKKYSGKDARVKCLKAFAKTEDGAKVLKQLGMAKPVFDAKTNTDMIFMAAHALVKTKRGNGLERTKDSTKWKDEDVENTSSEGKTAEELNEINAKHYGVAK
jgi:hypothetical protein